MVRRPAPFSGENFAAEPSDGGRAPRRGTRRRCRRCPAGHPTRRAVAPSLIRSEAGAPGGSGPTPLRPEPWPPAGLRCRGGTLWLDPGRVCRVPWAPVSHSPSPARFAHRCRFRVRRPLGRRGPFPVPLRELGSAGWWAGAAHGPRQGLRWAHPKARFHPCPSPTHRLFPPTAKGRPATAPPPPPPQQRSTAEFRPHIGRRPAFPPGKPPECPAPPARRCGALRGSVRSFRRSQVRSRAAGGWGQRRRGKPSPRGSWVPSGAGCRTRGLGELRRRRRLLRPSHRRSQPLRSLGSASAGVVGQSPGNLGPRAAGVGTLQNATRAGSLTSGTSGAGNPRPFGGNRSVPLPTAAPAAAASAEATTAAAVPRLRHLPCKPASLAAAAPSVPLSCYAFLWAAIPPCPHDWLSPPPPRRTTGPTLRRSGAPGSVRSGAGTLAAGKAGGWGGCRRLLPPEPPRRTGVLGGRIDGRLKPHSPVAKVSTGGGSPGASPPRGWQLPSLPRRGPGRRPLPGAVGKDWGALGGGLGCFPLDPGPLHPGSGDWVPYSELQRPR